MVRHLNENILWIIFSWTTPFSLLIFISSLKLIRCLYTLTLPKQWTLSDDRRWRYSLCMPNWMDRKSMWIWFVEFKITYKSQIAKPLYNVRNFSDSFILISVNGYSCYRSQTSIPVSSFLVETTESVMKNSEKIRVYVKEAGMGVSAKLVN